MSEMVCDLIILNTVIRAAFFKSEHLCTVSRNDLPME